MPKSPPLERSDTRSDARRMSGHSGPAHPKSHHHVHYSAHGDRGQENFHTGSANSSKAPHVTAGRPVMTDNGNGGNNGSDAA
jgi:hypothetical protein